MEQKLWSLMDRFFIMLISLSGEDYDDINISSVL